MPSYMVLEWNRLPYGDGDGCIPHHHADRLAAVARQSAFSGRGGAGVLEHGRDALRARGIVGVLASGDVSLEILPKIALDPDNPSGLEPATIRERLVHMLAVALDLPVDTGSPALLSTQRQSLLDILIRIFCDRLTETLRKGMPRQYVGAEDDLTVLRGRLDIARQFTRLAVMPARIACRYDLLSDDMMINQIMKTTITCLARHARHAATQQRLRELAFLYADITELPVRALRWDQAVLDRNNRRWKGLLAMARLFLEGRYQTTTSGTAPGISLLFDMNTLFEEYVGRLVSRSALGTGYSVSRQGGGRYCLTHADSGREYFQTRPDILIHGANGVARVIDTKWKRILPRIDDPKQGVAQADIYQMMAYAHVYEAPHLILLYPHHARLGPKEGVQASYRLNGHGGLLDIASIDLTRPENMLQRLQKIAFAASRTTEVTDRSFDLAPH